MKRPFAAFWKAFVGILKVILWAPLRTPDWVRKAIFIGLAAAGLDQFWLSKQQWYSDMPMTGYSYQQKLLQEHYEDANDKLDVVIFDISQAFPSGNRIGFGTDLQSDVEQERRENLLQLGNLLKDIARFRPAAIAIDWQISPSRSEIGNDPAHPRFASHYVSLFTHIKEVVDSGVPVVFGADWVRSDAQDKVSLPVDGLEDYAATLSINEPSVGPYHAGGKTTDRGGLRPLAVRVAEIVLARKPEDPPLWAQYSWTGFSTEFQGPTDDAENEYWINYEAVPDLLRQSFELSAANDNNEIPMITNDEAGETLRGRIVVLGDLRDRNPSDSVTLPITNRCTSSPEKYLGPSFQHLGGPPDDRRRALRNQMAISSTAGVLIQASAIHTLMGRPIRSFSNNLSGFVFAMVWGLSWGLIGEIAAFVTAKVLKLKRQTAYAEMHILALDFVLGTAFACLILVWLSSLTYLHTVIVPLVPAMVIATIADAGVNMSITVLELRRGHRKHSIVE